MPDTTAVPQGIELKLSDGSVIKADTPEEALKIAVKMKEDTSGALKETREQMKAQADQLTALQSRFDESQRPKPAAGDFDQQEYWRLMNTNVVAAQNYVDAFRFGIADPSKVPQYFEKIQVEMEKMRGDNLGSQFMQKHYEEFPASEEAGKALGKRVQELNAQGFPVQLETMDLAWQQLVAEGKLKPLEKAAIQDREEPNPSMSGAGSSPIPDSEIAKAEQMSNADLEKYLKSKGML